MKAVEKLRKKARQVAIVAGLAITQGLVAFAQGGGGSGAPSITVTPEAFNGSQGLITLLDYAMYAAWIFVFGLIIYAVFEMRNGVLSEGVKKALGGAIGAAFLLTFGWAILTGVI
ncbi:hypothetical protein Stok01_02464 [Sulfurisphaera tokodaii]|nr:hypothetical protein [Sulfurisphaera tokodaii]